MGVGVEFFRLGLAAHRHDGAEAGPAEFSPSPCTVTVWQTAFSAPTLASGIGVVIILLDLGYAHSMFRGRRAAAPATDTDARQSPLEPTVILHF